ncbi:hypothetical protein [Kibdelosporangium phytohabitans]|uniref:Transcriptional regulator n=1 Tax=Kibdelosporangium phytohabitans TaxID=860235 RepID=A0A0N9IBC2_9PSEU|nr:hypothetical protein [Kibdelosporangium phytohabitans]ALG11997.1 hypothetical protein AOZ06_38595 [Kibdelosporangium phytohabitans]MBE1463466.1 tetratricopeptide (TPR) repeat protein [Kibdelosporangium phytohabitans]
MNLYERLRAAADHVAAPDCELDVRRGLRQVEQRYRTALTGPSGPEHIDIGIALDVALERAYRAGVAARDRGDLNEAAHQLLVAADHQVGDAPLLLAEVLIELGDHEGALRWCDVADQDGFDEAQAVAARCREQMSASKRPRERAAAYPLPDVRRHPDRDEDTKRQQLLAHAEAITMGAIAIDSGWGMAEHRWPDDAQSAWYGRPIGMTEVRQTEAATRALRSLDYQYGGASTRSGVMAQLKWAEPMLAASCPDVVRRRLRTALADLHNLAGWVSFDVGLADAARFHFTRAMDLASHTGDDTLLTNVLWHAGRMCLYEGVPAEAMKYFHLGETAAARTGDSTLAALVIGGQAWATSLLDDERETLNLLKRMRRTLAEPYEPPSPHIVFNAETLYTTIGSTYAVLARRAGRHAPAAIGLLNRALDTCTAERQRCRTSLYTTLAGSHLANDDIPEAGHTGTKALRAADNIQSGSLDGQFRELKNDADRHTHPTARQLADRIAERLLRRTG